MKTFQGYLNEVNSKYIVSMNPSDKKWYAMGHVGNNKWMPVSSGFKNKAQAQKWAKSQDKVDIAARGEISDAYKENMKTFKDHINEVRVKFFTADEKDRYVSDEIKKRKLAKIVVNATDDRKMIKGKPTFTFPTPSGEMVISVWLRKMTAPATKDTMAFNYSIEDK